MMKLVTVILSFVAFMLSSSSFAQCDSIANSCQAHIAEHYISDGQVYRSLLSGDDVAEFQTTLFGGNTYRIAVCSGINDSNLIFRLSDQEHNLLFSNTDYDKAPYWDFYVENTMSVSIEVLLDNTRKDSGCAVVVIGFKK
jgi:hypothetical protein